MKGKPFTAVMSGCGGIAGTWLKALQGFDDIKITGLVDLNLEAAQRRKEEFQLQAEIGASLEDMLQQQHPDLVFDCTIPDAHFEVITAALRHGCHVLGEKPMAPDMASAQKMVAAAEKAEKTYAVIQNRRYLNGIVNFRDLIRAGEIGSLTTLNADFYLGPHFGGFRENMEHVLLLDMAIHSFDQARFISGADPVEVFCHEFNPAGSWYRHGASAMAIFTMSDGSIFNYRGSWCSPGLPTSWQCAWRACGSNGAATWDGQEAISAEKVVGTEGFFPQITAVAVPDGKLAFTDHAGVIREFVDCLNRGKKPQTICSDNIKSLAMVHAAIASAETKQPVTIKL